MLSSWYSSPAASISPWHRLVFSGSVGPHGSVVGLFSTSPTMLYQVNAGSESVPNRLLRLTSPLTKFSQDSFDSSSVISTNARCAPSRSHCDHPSGAKPWRSAVP